MLATVVANSGVSLSVSGWRPRHSAWATRSNAGLHGGICARRLRNCPHLLHGFDRESLHRAN
jgi:hypothetical protein